MDNNLFSMAMLGIVLTSFASLAGLILFDIWKNRNEVPNTDEFTMEEMRKMADKKWQINLIQ